MWYAEGELLNGGARAAALSRISLDYQEAGKWTVTVSDVHWESRGSFSGPERYTIRMFGTGEPRLFLCGTAILEAESGSGIYLRGEERLWSQNEQGQVVDS